MPSLTWSHQVMLLSTLLSLSSHAPVLAVGGPSTSLPEFGSLLAPVYRPVETGNAWVFPNSSFDLGARSMTCECFDPSETCCMPKSATIPPFCAVQNETCCADTYCLAGENCCGDFCCPAETTCNNKLSGSGCCPIGKICNTPVTCYDHSSSNCSNTLVTAAGCCPADTPYCRNFQPNGLGCYVNSTAPTSSSSGAGILITTSNPGSSTSSESTITSVPLLNTLAQSPASSKPSTTSAPCHERSNFPTPNLCSPTTSVAPAKSSNGLGYSPPGTSVYHSQASIPSSPMSLAFNHIKANYILLFQNLKSIFSEIIRPGSANNCLPLPRAPDPSAPQIIYLISLVLIALYFFRFIKAVISDISYEDEEVSSQPSKVPSSHDPQEQQCPDKVSNDNGPPPASRFHITNIRVNFTFPPSQTSTPSLEPTFQDWQTIYTALTNHLQTSLSSLTPDNVPTITSTTTQSNNHTIPPCSTIISLTHPTHSTCDVPMPSIEIDSEVDITLVLSSPSSTDGQDAGIDNHTTTNTTTAAASAATSFATAPTSVANPTSAKADLSIVHVLDETPETSSEYAPETSGGEEEE